MGRIFEVRKQAKFARWDRMAKQFSRVGKDIAIAVRLGGGNGDPNDNPHLRRCVQNAKAVNMPKRLVDAAIQRAIGKDKTDYHEEVYEGYAPHGIAVLIETATDNSTRTVANVRMHFNKNNGTLGTSGSVSYMFTHMGEFKIKNEGQNQDEMELEFIDYGLQEIGEDTDGNIIIHTAYEDFGNMSDALDKNKVEVISSELTWIPNNTIALNEDQENDVLKLVDDLEQDDDVQKVYHNLR